MTAFNAWIDPWVPVQRGEEQILLSLRDLFLTAHNLTGLGADLTPLERESVYRLLISLGAIVGRFTPEDGSWTPEQGFPASAVSEFEGNFLARFELFGDHPFLQRWDQPQNSLTVLTEAAGSKPLKGLLAVEQLHPHEPGGSSSKWAVRRDTRDAATLSTATLLLVVAWFQTKNGNGQDPWGGKALKGSAGTWHTNPMSLWQVDPANLAKTLWANTPEVWLDQEDLPVFLEHDFPASAFTVNQKDSVARFTYAVTLPLLQLHDGALKGFVIGADQTITVPQLGRDAKESLGVIHEHDHTRLYVEKKTAKGVVTALIPRGSFEARLATTEGFAQWFRSDRGISEALGPWRSVPRVLTIPDSERHLWNLEVLSERTDGKGSREFAAWDSLPAAFAGAEGAALELIRALLDFAGKCRWAFLPAGRTATGESKSSPAIITGQAAFYSAIEPVIAALRSDLTDDTLRPSREYAQRVSDIAVIVFAATTEPLMTPRQIAAVAQARTEFRALVRSSFNKAYPAPLPATSKESA